LEFLQKNLLLKHNKKNVLSQAIFEVQPDLNNDLLPYHDDPLKWWKNYKYLSTVVQEKCALESVPCKTFLSWAS
jgi:hypothetical protein